MKVLSRLAARVKDGLRDQPLGWAKLETGQSERPLSLADQDDKGRRVKKGSEEKRGERRS